MKRLGYLAGSLLVAASCCVLATRGVSAATPPATDLQNDIQAGQAGDTGVANDVDTAAEKNADDGQVADVQEQNGQAGDQQNGTAGDSHTDTQQGQSAADNSQAGDQGTTGDTGETPPPPR